MWAGPNTLLGAAFGGVVLCLGGRVQFVCGAAEFHGGLVGRAIASLPGPLSFNAITFGHVILAISEAALCAFREHEQVHVRQYERWGPFFLPAYVVSSIWEVVHGRRAYWDNFFERQAFAVDAQEKLRDVRRL
jgi:hypothetical protein